MEKQEMKQYTCIKTVKARPCSRKEAEAIMLRRVKPLDAEDEVGYLVEYADGYKSWSPKKAFEEGYVLTDNYVDRMKFELSQLRERIVKGTQFYLQPIQGDNFNYELREQLEHMSRYAEVLMRRIFEAEHPSPKGKYGIDPAQQ